MKQYLLALLFTGFIVAGTSGKSFAAPALNPANNHWYEIVSSGNDGSWDNAENNAIAWGGHLVTINDSAEESWLISTFGNYRYWIGLNDAASEGNWVWSSGEPVSYIHWAPGEPNNCTPPSRGEDYAVLNWAYGWNDWDHQRPDYGYINGIAEKPVPEPASMLLLGSGLLGLLGLKRKKN